MLRLTLSALGMKDEVASYPDVLQYSALNDLIQQRSVETYVASCAEMLLLPIAEQQRLQQSMLEFANRDFSAYDSVVVWRGESAGDRLFCYFVCANVGRDLSVVDLSPLREVLPNPNVGAITMGVCSQDNIQQLLNGVHPLSMEDKTAASEKWHHWSQSQSALRLLDKSGSVLEASQSLFDELIIDACREEWQSAARIIGRLLCQVGFVVGDSFLHHRLISLAKSGAIRVRANEQFYHNGECIAERYAQPRIVCGVDLGELRLFEVSKS